LEADPETQETVSGRIRIAELLNLIEPAPSVALTPIPTFLPRQRRADSPSNFSSPEEETLRVDGGPLRGSP
jgi:hypothetical protein